MRNILSLTTCLMLVGFCGCMTIPKPDMSAWKPAGPVTTVLASWGTAVSNGENPERGFGGRVYFYDQDMVRPVKVKGTVIVYAFDEDGRSQFDAKPNEGYVFDSKTLNSKGVYSKSKLGHSYNLWIPLDEAKPESPSRKISLIVRYIPEHGASVVSPQTTAHLPGRREQDLLAAQVEESEFDGTAIQRVPVPQRSVPERVSLTEERLIESNVGRARTMQSVAIR